MDKFIHKDNEKTNIFLYWEIESIYKGGNPYILKGTYDRVNIIPTEKLNRMIELMGEDRVMNDLFSMFDIQLAVDELLDKFERQKGLESKIHKMQAVIGEVIKKEEGMYYAHEYDKYANAVRYTVEYSNGYSEYIILCLNPDLIVLDGFWEDPDHNGCGDYYENYRVVYEKEKQNA